MSGRNCSMKSYTIYQHNGLKLLINSNNSDDIEMNGDFNNVDVSCGIVFINNHTLS